MTDEAGDSVIKMRMSISVTLLQSDDTMNAAIARADEAMCAAKRAGTNGVATKIVRG